MWICPDCNIQTEQPARQKPVAQCSQGHKMYEYSSSEKSFLEGAGELFGIGALGGLAFRFLPSTLQNYKIYQLGLIFSVGLPWILFLMRSGSKYWKIKGPAHEVAIYYFTKAAGMFAIICLVGFLLIADFFHIPRFGRP